MKIDRSVLVTGRGQTVDSLENLRILRGSIVNMKGSASVLIPDLQFIAVCAAVAVDGDEKRKDKRAGQNDKQGK